ncbi:MAG: DMT family transporter [Proteobacteria bacterium]|nr:DMT family transporter [Pseudomonadota bacterium]
MFNLIILIMMSLAWASSYVVISTVELILSPLSISAALTTVGAIVMVFIVRVIQRRPLLPTLISNPVPLLVMSLTAISLPQLSVVIAEKDVAPGLAAVIGTTVPVATFLVSAFILKTTPKNWINLLGIFVAVAGIVTFADPKELMAHKGAISSIGIMMAGGLVFVANGIYAQRATCHLDQIALTTWILIFAAIGLSTLALVFEGGLPEALLNTKVLMEIGFGGAITMAAAYYLYYFLLARAGASFACLYAFLVPPLGVLLSVMFAGMTLDVHNVVGLGVSLMGLALVFIGNARSGNRS